MSFKNPGYVCPLQRWALLCLGDRSKKKAGILRDKTMDCKLINISNDDNQNYPFFIQQLLSEAFGQNYFKTTNNIQGKYQKFLSQRIR